MSICLLLLEAPFKKYSIIQLYPSAHSHDAIIPGHLMSTYNLQYRGGKLRPGARDSLLVIARAARKPRSPTGSSQSYKENNVLLDTRTCRETQIHTSKEAESLPTYFFRARKSLCQQPKPPPSRGIQSTSHKDTIADLVPQPHPDPSDCVNIQNLQSALH
jgi:hypothetical protein